MDTHSSGEMVESHETQFPMGTGTGSRDAAAANEVQELAQADTTSGSFAGADPKVLKEVLAAYQEHLDSFIKDSGFDDEERAFAIELAERTTSSLNAKIWADTDGQVYAPLGVDKGPRSPEASEEDGEGAPAKVEVAQGGKKKKARKHNRRRQKR